MASETKARGPSEQNTSSRTQPLCDRNSHAQRKTDGGSRGWTKCGDARLVGVACDGSSIRGARPFASSNPISLLLTQLPPPNSDWGRSTSTIKYGADVPTNPSTIRTAIKEAKAAICLLEQELLLEFALENEMEESEKAAKMEGSGVKEGGAVATEKEEAAREEQKGGESNPENIVTGTETTKTPVVPSNLGGAGEGGEDAAAGADYEDWAPPVRSVPICGDVRNVDFDRLAVAQKKARGSLFDVIMMDPPWQLASSNPTRGVAIGYSQLADWHIQSLPVRKLQENGFIFMW